MANSKKDGGLISFANRFGDKYTRKVTIHTKDVICTVCTGTGRVEEYHYDGHNYKIGHGKFSKCIECNGRGCVEETWTTSE